MWWGQTFNHMKLGRVLNAEMHWVIFQLIPFLPHCDLILSTTVSFAFTSELIVCLFEAYLISAQQLLFYFALYWAMI